MHNRSSRLLSVSVILLAGFVQAASAADEKTVGAKDRTQLNLTIYNGNLALIQDQRRLSLDKGLNRVGFAGVSRAMMPSTAFLAVTSARPVKILEQDFAFDLLTPSKISEHAVLRDAWFSPSYRRASGANRHCWPHWMQNSLLKPR
jgi:hypothetical protein